jgi:diguanylate cyclase (GGDEF)-like protein
MTGVLGTLLVAAVLGLAYVVSRLMRQERQLREQRHRTEQLQSLLSDGSVRASRGLRVAATPADLGDRGDPLADVLLLVRDALGAAEVTYWRRRADGSLAPFASTRGTTTPELDDALPLAQWADTEGMTTVDTSNEEAHVAATPVPGTPGLETRGALVVRAARAFPLERGQVKRQLESYGAVAARVLTLLESQRAMSHQNSVIRSLLNASQDFAGHRNAERLAERICETAVAIVGAHRAALVRWDAARASGQVVAVSLGHPVTTGQVVSPISATGEACAELRTVVWQDAPTSVRGMPVFAPGEPAWRTGSLAALPLPRGRSVLGALVVESDQSSAMRDLAIRNLGLLAAIAVAPLESLWDYEEVERRARTDALTGVWNRRHFEAELDRWLGQIDRYGGTISLVMCDVDHFKLVNDTHGHEVGDAVLRHVAGILRDGARTVDVVARLGGEEFGVLLPSTPADGAAEVAERLRAALESHPPRLPGGALLTVTASFGVASHPVPVSKRDGLVAAADAALYAAKRGGRNRVEIATG